ncbi:MAG: arylsulfatase, partial [Akkermansiaceae bacterium]|nr:arylsulfatase [Akkermansiaceae bacterium]
FVYYAPGAVRIAEKASAPVKGRSHRIETTIDLKGGEEGVILACGGMTGGYCMFIKGGRVYFDYNFLDGVFYTLESEPLPEG